MTAITSDSEAVSIPLALESSGEVRTSRFSALAGLDLRNTWQVVAGAILLPLGIAAIVLGWQGAAHGRVDQQQIPYLISGGLLGLALVIMGGLFFWGHWLYRIYDQANLQHEATLRSQAEFQRTVLLLLAHNGSLGNGIAQSDSSTVTGSGRTFVATASGTNFHTADCAIVSSRKGKTRSVSAQEAQRMQPCRICDPLGS